MLTSDQINDLHHLYWVEHWPIRKIEQHLGMSWRTIKKYLDAPAQTPAARSRTSKLDRFKPTITELLEKDARASAAVIEQRLRPLGYDGGHSILREYIHKVRPQPQSRRAFVRMEPEAGERFEVDWGHFGTLNYEGDQRKLYAFALVDGHSRMSYLEFTHSQCFESFVRCHIHAFAAFNGVSREVFYDNLASAVAEHDGRLVRFNPRFLAFAREYNFVPRACNQASGWEKGKVERGGIGYVRQNFWPLREFTDLHDVNRQARQWVAEIANQRLHQETRQRPIDRFRADALRPLPVIPYDYRDTAEPLVHKDLRLRFDGNRYCVPHRFVGQRLTVKADSSSVTIYHRYQEIVSYARSWRRGQTFGAERFERERNWRHATTAPLNVASNARACTALVVDELGYLALDQQTSNLFYQVISTRHSQKRSTIITTNTAFSDWGNILFNTTIATAIADRLVENSEIFLLGGDSLRKPKNSNPPAQ